MENYLFYCYLKFRYDEKNPWKAILRETPWQIKLSMVALLAFVCSGMVFYGQEATKTIGKVCYLLSFATSVFLHVVIEHVQIKSSKARFSSFRKYCQAMKTFLEQYGICQADDVEELKRRIDEKLVSEKQEIQLMKEHDEKWLQTLAIPVVLAIITHAIGNAENMLIAIDAVTSLLVLFFVGVLLLNATVSVMRYSRKWEVDNLTLFAEDLQGVLDLEWFVIPEEKAVNE